MIIDIPIFIVSLIFILVSANYLTNAAVHIAIFFNFSAFFVSSILIGVGTSLPEFIVSIMSALDSKPEISISNVLGSNIFNIFGIATLTFFSMQKANIAKLDYIIFNVSALMALFMIIVIIGEYNLFYLAVPFLTLVYFIVKSYQTNKNSDNCEESINKKNIVFVLFLAIFWLFVIIFASRMFLSSLNDILMHYHVSPKLIGTLIVAIGTSLPEIAACAASLSKKRIDVALGNIIGSNIFNILMVLNLSRYFIKNINADYSLDVYILLLFTFVFSLTIRFHKISKFAYIFVFLPVYSFFLWSLF